MKLLPRNNAHEIFRPGYYFCWNCGRGPRERMEKWHGPWTLQIAHIASGQGRAVRTPDVSCVVSLCPACHDCHVSDADRLPFKVICGQKLPTIDERHTLWIKQAIDKENMWPELLEQIWIGKPPEPVRPPEFWCKEFTRRTGIWR